jgi:hypothetical protein
MPFLVRPVKPAAASAAQSPAGIATLLVIRAHLGRQPQEAGSSAGVVEHGQNGRRMGPQGAAGHDAVLLSTPSFCWSCHQPPGQSNEAATDLKQEVGWCGTSRKKQSTRSGAGRSMQVQWPIEMLTLAGQDSVNADERCTEGYSVGTAGRLSERTGIYADGGSERIKSLRTLARLRPLFDGACCDSLF